MVSFLCNIFVWFWYWGNTSFSVGKCFYNLVGGIMPFLHPKTFISLSLETVSDTLYGKDFANVIKLTVSS